jgi:hypothetical protein
VTAKTAPVPSQAMSTPPIAGPRIRARFSELAFRAMAVGMSVGPTISPANACRAGDSRALTVPSTAAST